MAIFSLAIYTGAYLGLGVDRVLETSGPTDRIFYFAGHGGANPGEHSLTLFPVNQLDDEGAMPLTSAELMEFVKPALVRGDRVFLFIDTAYAGAAAAEVNAMVTKFPRAKGLIFAFFSSDGNETSADSSAVSDTGSPFTFFLLRGWQGAADTNNNGAITLLELMDYLRGKVLASTSNSQRPLFAGHARTEMVLPQLFGPKIYQSEQVPIQAGPQIPVNSPAPSPAAKSENEPLERAALGNLKDIPDTSATPAPDQYQTLGQQAQTTAAPFSSVQPSPDAAYPTPIPDGPGGIDIEYEGKLLPRAQANLTKALTSEGLAPRNWKTGTGPTDIITIKYYFPEDSDRAQRIRRVLERTLQKFRIEVPDPFEPPKGYRRGHVDIWLPAAALKRLLDVR